MFFLEIVCCIFCLDFILKKLFSVLFTLHFFLEFFIWNVFSLFLSGYFLPQKKTLWFKIISFDIGDGKQFKLEAVSFQDCLMGKYNLDMHYSVADWSNSSELAEWPT